MKRQTTLFVEDIKPVVFCGKQIMWEINANGAYEIPFETMSTKGEHDFNTCEECQKFLTFSINEFTALFEGKRERKAFPFCCEKHIELISYKGVSVTDYLKVPEWTAKKIIYTRQHIINNIEKENYYEEITDYIDYTIDSFGQTPNNSEPLFLSSYFDEIILGLEKDTDIPKEKKGKILEYFKSFNTPTENKTDLNILIATYEKWFKIFPWEISFFINLKPQFEKPYILKSKLIPNKYSDKVLLKPHTKDSLIELLLNITNTLLTQINGFSLYEKGLLTDPQKIKLDLVLNERRMKLQQGYIDNSTDESTRYRHILKAWFVDEKKFINEIMSTLSPQSTNEQSKHTNQGFDNKKVNFEPLRIYIKYTKVDNLFQSVLPQLNELKLVDSKEKAALTKILYSCNWWNAKRPKTFKQFEREFFALFGWNVTKYRSSQLDVTVENLKIKHPFLSSLDIK